jgi:hypothetical protein
MTINATFTDAQGKLTNHRQIEATVRGESEYTGGADSIVKSLSKHYSTISRSPTWPAIQG